MRFRLSALCCATIAAACSGEALASPTLKQHRITLPAYVTVPTETSSSADKEFTVREGDIILSAPIGYAKGGRLATAISVDLGGLTFSLASGERIPQVVATGGDLNRLPAGAAVLCDFAEQYRRKELPEPAGSVGQRFEAETQLCVADSDGDGQMDKAFVSGTRLSADRAMIDIAPVAYELLQNTPIPGSELRVVYYDGSSLWSANFEVHVFLEGQRHNIDNVTFEGEPKRTSWFLFPKKKLGFPQSIKVGPASFQVMTIDKVGKSAVIRRERDFPAVPLRWYYKYGAGAILTS